MQIIQTIFSFAAFSLLVQLSLENACAFVQPDFRIKENWRVSAHDGRVEAIAISKDSKTIFTAGVDGKVKALNSSNRKDLKTVHATKQSVKSIEVNGAYLLVSDDAGKIYQFSIDGGKTDKFVYEPSEGYVLQAGFFDNCLIFVTQNGMSQWSLETGKTLIDEYTKSFQRSDSRRAICVANYDGSVKIRSSLSHEDALVLKPSRKVVPYPSMIAWTDDDSKVAVLRNLRIASEIEVVDLKSENPKLRNVMHRDTTVSGIAFLRKDLLVCAGNDIRGIQLPKNKISVLATAPSDSEAIRSSFARKPIYFTTICIGKDNMKQPVLYTGTADGILIQWSILLEHLEQPVVDD